MSVVTTLADKLMLAAEINQAFAVFSTDASDASDATATQSIQLTPMDGISSSSVLFVF